MKAARASALMVAVLGLTSSCQAPEPRPAGEQRADPLWFQEALPGLPREHQSAVLLFDGRVLVTGGYDTTAIGTTEIYDPTTGEVKTVQALTTPRWYQTAVMLRSGRPLIIAGKIPGVPNSTATTELFDPVTEKWSAGPTLNARRERHTTTVLDDGRVLLVGDWGGTEVTNEILDPDAGVWTVLPGQMGTPRSSHSAVLLADGRVLVAGGFNNFPARDVELAEIFDPRTSSWADAGIFGLGRKNPAMVRLLDGRVLLASGLREVSPPTGISDEVSIFDPDGGTWTVDPNLLATRGAPSLSPLPDQRYLIAGGTGTGSNEADLFSLDGGRVLDTLGAGNNIWGQTAVTLPSGEIALFGGSNSAGPSGRVFVHHGARPQWTTAATLPAGQLRHTATLLPDGTVLVVGLGGAWRYSPTANAWADAGQAVRDGHTATLLADGRVLVVGQGTRADLYDPSTGVWSSSTPMPGPREGHTATLLADGRVLVAAGSTDGSDSNALESALVFDPNLLSWTPAGSLSVPRLGHFATVLRDGRAVVMGGTPTPSSAEVYDPATNTFIGKPFTTAAHRFGVGALLPSGRVLLAGGCCPFTAGAEVLDPATFSWRDGGSLGVPFSGATASVMHSGRTLIVGGVDGGAARLGGAWGYDPRRPSFDPLPSPAPGGARLSATRLLDGRVLVVGTDTGMTTSTGVQLFEESAGFLARPRLDPIASPVVQGSSRQITGKGWTHVPENSTGHHLTSATNYPLLRLERLDTQEIRYARLLDWTDTQATAVMPDELRAGFYVARIVVSGVPSGGEVFRVDAPPFDGGTLDGGLGDGGLTDGGATGDGGSGDGGSPGPDGGNNGSDGGATTEPLPGDYRVGCGCGAAPPLPWALALLALSAARARRRSSRS